MLISGVEQSDLVLYICIYTHNKMKLYIYLGFPAGSAVKNLPANAGGAG